MVLALVASACTSGSDSENADSSVPTTSAVLDSTTTEAPPDSDFETQECEGLNLSPGVDATCGIVAVPANWETGEGSFRLAVAVLKSTSDSPEPDPVFYLDGGPGSHALDTMQYRMDDFFGPLTERGDVVVFDQRGAGRSEPVAACPEFTEVTDEEARSPDKATPAELAERFLNSLTACGQRLRSEGVAVDDLNTQNNARDVDAIREALGYESVNLLGISYGTRLGLEVVRQFPNSTRSLVLDSVFPHPVDAAVENPGTFAASYDAVVAACAAEPACAAEGDLGVRIEAAVAKLEESPMEAEVVSFVDGSTETIYVDGDGLVELINSSLYSPQTFTDFPELMTGIETDDPSPLSLFASLGKANASFVTTGMFLAIACADEYSFSNPADVLAAAPEDRFGLVPPELAANATFDQCNAFTGAVSDPVMNEPVSSDVPTLVMAGEFDPVTPVAWAQLAAETLPNSQTVIFPGEAHGVSPSDCGLKIVLEFLDDPGNPVDQGCADDFVPVFIAGETQAITEFETKDVSIGGVGATVVVPKDWTHTSDGFISDARRGLSVLDSAEMLQFVGAESVVFSVDSTLAAQFGAEFAAGPDREIAGETWGTSSFATDEISVTSFKTERNGSTVVLYMFSSALDHESLVETVLVEAASGFQLQ